MYQNCLKAISLFQLFMFEKNDDKIEDWYRGNN